MKKLFLFVVMFFAGFSAYAETPHILKSQMNNGLRYVIYKSSSVPVIAVDIKVKAGSYFDPQHRFGLAKVTAQCLGSCGTKDVSSEGFRKMADKNGINISIRTSKEYTDIHAESVSSRMKTLFYIVSQMLKPRFNKNDFENVKRKAADSVTSLKNNYDYIAIHSSFVNLINGSSYSHSSVGDIKDIKKITIKDARLFYNRYYSADNIIISVSGGGFDKLSADRYIKEYFSFLHRKNGIKLGRLKFNKADHISNSIKNVKQSYIYVSFPSVGLLSRYRYDVKILSFILGGGLQSVLSEDIRKKRGYAYSVFSLNYDLKNGGIFVIGLQTQNKYTLKAIDAIFSDIVNIEHFIDNRRVELAKRFIIGSMPIGLQSSLSVADKLSDIYILNIDELPWIYDKKHIKNVSLQDVKSIAREIFRGNVSIGIVSNKDYTKDIDVIVKKYEKRSAILHR